LLVTLESETSRILVRLGAPYDQLAFARSCLTLNVLGSSTVIYANLHYRCLSRNRAGFTIALIQNLPDKLLVMIARAARNHRELVGPGVQGGREVCRALLQLRLTSRALSRVATTALSETEWFRQRYVMLNRHSLTALRDISLHPIFSPMVQTLKIGLQHLSKNQYNFFMNIGLDVATQSSARDAYTREELDHTFMMDCGLTARYLAEAVRALLNLKKVSITVGEKMDFPWGSAVVDNQIKRNALRAFRPSVHDRDNYFFARAICTIISILADSGVSLDKFELLLYNRQTDAMAPMPFIASLPPMTPAPMHSISVREITLEVQKNTLTRPMERWVADVSRFLDLFTNLEVLRVARRMTLLEKCHDSSLEGLAPDLRVVDDACFMHLLQKLRLPRLRSLSLGDLGCTSNSLWNFLLAHKGTLELMELTWVSLVHHHEWVDLIVRIRKESPVQQLKMEYCASLDRGSYLLATSYLVFPDLVDLETKEKKQNFKFDWDFSEVGHTEEDIRDIF